MALQVKGYKALAVPLSPDGAAPFTAFTYVRQHYSKGCVCVLEGGRGWCGVLSWLIDRSVGKSIRPCSPLLPINIPTYREEDLPQGRTLFLANVPMRVGLDPAAYLREAFGRCVVVCRRRLQSTRLGAPRCLAFFPSAPATIGFPLFPGMERWRTFD